MEPNRSLVCECEYNSVVNFAIQQNHIPVIKKLSIKSNEEDIEGIKVKLTTIPEFSMPLEINVDVLPSNQFVDLGIINFQLSADYLATLTERISGALIINVLHNEEVIYEQSLPMDVLAYDEWNGTLILPEIIGAFVTPNHPEVSKILKESSDIMNKWTNDPSLSAYQSNDPNRVKLQAAAIYAAIKSKDITYCVAPPSFEKVGQRIRLTETLLNQKMGNCLDLSIFYAACLEAAGLNPLIIFTTGHAFVGLWLINESFSESVQDEISLITKRIASGVQEICVIEATALTAGKITSFDESIKLAHNNLSKVEDFDFFVDIKRARASGIRPLPLRVMTESGWEIIEEDNKIQSIEAPELIKVYDKLTEASSNMTKQKQWERKLLDLSLKNNLLNLRVTKSSIPIMATQLSDLEDALADGEDFEILPRPTDWDESPRITELYQNQSSNNPIVELLKQEFSHKRLRADLNNKELTDRTIKLYRAAKIALEENGANTLYLALGMLKWYESDISQMPRYAPLILIPVELIRKSIKSGYVIRARDEEAHINITLLEMLRQDFGINIAEMDPLPKDEKGIDLNRIFSEIRHSIMSETRWDIVETAHLGLFSFSQFVMWNDIKNRADELARNKVVSSLLESKLQWTSEEYFVEDFELDEKYHPKDVYLPISADSSQLSAICASGEGKSFVLHGPPGTGKSQTITNIIANAVANGKTVLFVAEKMAALSVVQNRLEKIGLDAFCLELHSNKSTKKAVLDQLKKALEVGKANSSDEWLSYAEKISQSKKELNTYVSKLHQKTHIGLSLYEVLTRYDRVRKSPDVVAFDKKILNDLTSDKISEWTELVQELQVAGKACGEPSKNVWKDSNLTDYTKSIKTDINNLLESYKHYLSEYRITLPKVLNRLRLGIDVNTSKELEVVEHISKMFIDIPEAPHNILRVDDINTTITRVMNIAKRGQSRNEIRNIILSLYKDNILTFDATTTLEEWQKCSIKWFLPKTLGQNKIYKLLKLNSNTTILKEQVEDHLRLIIKLQEEEKYLNDSDTYASPLLGIMWNEGEGDWGKIIKACEWVYSLHSITIGLYKDSNRLREVFNNIADMIINNTELTILKGDSDIHKLVRITNEIDSIEKELSNILVMDFNNIKQESDGMNWFNYISDKISNWENKLDELREWSTWVRIRTKVNDVGLTNVINPYEQGILDNANLVASYEQGLYKVCAELIISNDSDLNTFSSSLFEDKIKQFKEINNRYEVLTIQEIYVKLASRIPNVMQNIAQSSEIGILQRAIRSNGRGISIRKLFDQIPNLLTRLCPCMLMSPISVAQYLDPKHSLFDLVVFDEASQMPTCKAVGAIARGKELIVVGDPNQMPPTSFFKTTSSEEEDENIATEDLESILDDCLALGMPQEHLLWHYRSKHESLIAFSNVQYYDNKLLTYPSPNDLISSVTLCHIDGYYDRGKSKQNKNEAIAIVDEIIRRLNDPILSKRSIGVVTFNSIQQTLIEDLFDEALRNNPELEALALGSQEPIFIKNLENVQGDERDVILFSVGYGPDINGKVSLNFGPLNRDGGWRRLNVAVSRARYEMKVFSTLKSEHIDLSRTNAQGVQGLKAFLEYAEKGKEIFELKNADAYKINREGIEKQIAEEIKGLGYNVKLHAGTSGYRIDIGVIDPRKPGEYILGIMCDGYVYQSSRTARDREIIRGQVLKHLGWNLHKVWSLDWWENPKREIQKIDSIIKSLLESEPVMEYGANTEKPDEQEKTIINTVNQTMQQQDAKDELDKYTAFYLENSGNNQEEFYLPQNIRKISQQIITVIENEGPISRSLLCKRIMQAWNISRTGAKIERHFSSLFNSMSLNRVAHNGVEFFWPKNMDPIQYNRFRIAKDENERRNPEDLPPEEIASAVKYSLSYQLSLPQEDLEKEVLRIMGYQRIGTATRQAMRTGIDLAIKKGFAYVDDNDRVVLKE